MAKVANNAQILKKRLKRFFESNNSGRKQVSLIANQLASLGQVYLFGGAIRDIALDGMRNFYSDLDFVVDASPKHLDQLLNKLSKTYSVKRNKFGGYRLKCDKWWLDIWALSNTWAFSAGKVSPNNQASQLLNTTILNWDAILYQVVEHKLVYKTDYFAQLSQGRLDLVLADNPNPKGAYVRVLRTLVSKKVECISYQLAQYLLAREKEFSYAELLDYEAQHFTTRYLSILNFSGLISLCQSIEKPEDVQWQGKQLNFSLPL